MEEEVERQFSANDEWKREDWKGGLKCVKIIVWEKWEGCKIEHL